MKNLIIATALILLSVITFGQTLQKGNLIGTHVFTINLKPGVTMDQFLKFYGTRFIPEFEKNRTGWKVYLVKGIRGEKKDSIGLIIVINSQGDRDKYYNKDGAYNELGKSTNEKLKPIIDELEKFATVTTKWTDWLVQ